ncbi:MAG: metalloprotease family protein [Oscillospiraceae bacterium]|nr:metalloprotease family protein [Oscillospiraceae bacterium]
MIIATAIASRFAIDYANPAFTRLLFPLLGAAELTTAMQLWRAAAWIGVVAAYVIILTPVHEAVHILVQPRKTLRGSEVTVLFALPAAVGIVTNRAVTKNRELLAIAAPFLFFAAADLIVLAITRNMPLFACLALINLSTASSDIVAFFYFLRRVPEGAYVQGVFYTLNTAGASND